MKQQSIAFKGHKLTLEGILTLPTDLPGPFPGVVICHGHPLFGENMESNLMQVLCRALDGDGIATLRFNFRGVGGSGGSFDRGVGEQEDLHAAITTLKKWPGVKGNRIGMAGVSFGAVVLLDILAKVKGVEALAAVSPTISGVRRSRFDKFKGAKLLMAGDKDLLVPSEELSNVVTELSLVPEYIVVPGADHAWAGHEDHMAARVVKFMATALQ
jgi:alpha/beta superfamily hydrolase